MKNYSLLSLGLASLLSAFSISSLRAAAEFWDPNGATVGTSVSGNWDTTTPNWTAAPDSGVNNTWVQGDDASFGVTANFTVTLTQPINLGSLTVTGNAGGLTIAGAGPNSLTLTGGASTFNIGGSRTNSVSAALVGSAALTKSGNGTLTLSGANTYSGGTTLSGGTIGIGVDSISSAPGVITVGALGTGTLNFSTAAAVFASGGAHVVHNPVTLNGALTNLGPQTLTFTSTTFQLVAANRNIVVNSGDLVIGSSLTDDGTARTLTKLGNGRLILAGDNSTYLGPITVSAGTLAPGTAGAFPTNNTTAPNQITVNGPGIINLNGFDLKVARLAGNATGQVLLGTNTLTAGSTASAEFSGVISGTGGYIKVGSVSQVLSGTNTFSGGITIMESALYLPTNGASGSPICLAAGTNTITIMGTGRIGANRSSGLTIITNSVTLATPAAGLDPANGNTFVLSGRVSGSGGFLRSSQGSGIAVLAGDNVFTGGVELDAQRLGITHPRALGIGRFSLGGPSSGGTGTIWTMADLSGANAVTNVTTINQNFSIVATNDFELSGPITIANLNATTVTTLGTNSIKFSGNIDGDGSINKQGTNNLILTGANTYVGPTAVSLGTLLVNNSAGSGTGTNSVSVFNGASLGGGGTVSGPVTVNFGGSIGGGTTAGKLTLQNGLDMTGGNGTNLWKLAVEKDDATGTPGTDFDQVSLTGGTLALGGSTTFVPQFIGAAVSPTFGDAFWRSNHTWKVIALSGGASNPGSSVFSIGGTNGINAGTFSASVDGSGNIILSYVARPAPPAPTIGNITGAGSGNTMLTWSTVDGVTYQVQYKDDLTASTWSVLGSVTASGSSASFTDTTTPPPAHRFYRVLVP